MNPELIRSCSTIDKDHGRLEVRSISTLAVHHTDLVFPGINQIARLDRTREILKYGIKNEEQVFLITNLSYDELGPEAFLSLKREYWAIENKLHYRLDFVFGEDRSTIRAGHGPQNMSSLRKFALGLISATGV